MASSRSHSLLMEIILDGTYMFQLVLLVRLIRLNSFLMVKCFHGNHVVLTIENFTVGTVTKVLPKVLNVFFYLMILGLSIHAYR